MNTTAKTLLSGILMVLALAGTSSLPAQAYYHYYYYGGNFFYNHPVLSDGLIGTGLGAVAGGVLAPDGNRAGGAVEGAALGGVAGAGLGLLTQPRYRW